MRTFLFLSLFTLCLSLFSQGIDSNTLNSKKEQLNQLKTNLKSVEEQVNKLQAEIDKLSIPNKYWKYDNFTFAQLNQSQFVNWVAGGENAISFVAGHDFALHYKNTNSKLSWDNRFSAMLGYRTAANELQKMNDQIILNSILGYDFKPQFSLASNLSVRTQFLPTPDYKVPERTMLSNFFSPAFINFGVGLTWKPTHWFSFYFSPVTLQSTFVTNPQVDPVTYGLEKGNIVKAEGGWNSNIEIATPLGKTFLLNVRTILFSNFMNPNANNDVDVDIRFKLDAKISNWFTASLFLNTKYDLDSKFKITNSDGSVTYKTAGWQFLENFGIGLSYKFDKML